MSEIKVGDIKLVYEIRGEGPSIININGTGLSSALWWQMPLGQMLLDAGYQVITFDNRGIPPSDVPPPPFTVEEMAQDTIGLLEHIDKGPYILMGASLGGLIAQTVCLQKPKLVKAVIFIVGCGNFSAYLKPFIQGWIDYTKTGKLEKSVLTALNLPLFIPPTEYSNAASIQAAIEIGQVFTPAESGGCLGQYYADQKWGNEEHIAELRGLKMPALAIANEFDPLFPPVLVKKAVAMMPKGEYVEIPNASHVSLNPDNSKQTDSAIFDFISRHASV